MEIIIKLEGTYIDGHFVRPDSIHVECKVGDGIVLVDIGDLCKEWEDNHK